MEKMTVEQYLALKTEIEKTIVKYGLKYTAILIIGFVFCGVAMISATALLEQNFINYTIFALSSVIGSTMVYVGILFQNTLLNPNHKNCYGEFNRLKKLDQLYVAGKSAEEAAKELGLLPAE
jgi:hypothetical protein